MDGEIISIDKSCPDLLLACFQIANFKAPGNTVIICARWDSSNRLPKISY